MADYCIDDIKNVFKKLGLKKGDNVFSHSNLGFFGRCEGAKSAQDLCETFKKSFLEIIGEEGTLVVPTFTYSFCHKEIFDPQNTISNMGMFSEYIRQLPEAIRSDDGNFSVAALGKNAEYFTENPPEYSFGKDSFFDKFKKMNGKFVNLNFDSGSTFIHYVERELKVPYRWDKPFDGILIKNGQEQKRRFYHFVYNPEIPKHNPNFKKFDKLAKEKMITKEQNLGKGTVLVLSAVDTYNFIEENLKIDKDFLIDGEAK